MSLRNPDLAELISDNTFPALLTIATFKCDDPADDRGRYYFGSEEGI